MAISSVPFPLPPVVNVVFKAVSGGQIARMSCSASAPERTPARLTQPVRVPSGASLRISLASDDFPMRVRPISAALLRASYRRLRSDARSGSRPTNRSPDAMVPYFTKGLADVMAHSRYYWPSATQQTAQHEYAAAHSHLVRVRPAQRGRAQAVHPPARLPVK